LPHFVLIATAEKRQVLDPLNQAPQAPQLHSFPLVPASECLHCGAENRDIFGRICFSYSTLTNRQSDKTCEGTQEATVLGSRTFNKLRTSNVSETLLDLDRSHFGHEHGGRGSSPS
jgi:hypothetical protein